MKKFHAMVTLQNGNQSQHKTTTYSGYFQNLKDFKKWLRAKFKVKKLPPNIYYWND